MQEDRENQAPQPSFDSASALTAKFEQALELHRAGELRRAQSIYEEILTHRPDHAGALHLSGLIEVQAKNSKKAVELIGRAIDIDPNDALMYLNRGSALQELQLWDAAMADYDRAIALDGDSAEAYSNRSIVMKERGLLDAALASCNRAIAIRPNFAEAHFNRGVILHGLSRPEAALSSYEWAALLRRGYSEALFNRGNVQRELRRWEAALASFEEAIAARPGYVGAYINRGNVLQELKRWDAALASYDQAIAINPGDSLAYLNRGNVLRALRRWQEALLSYEQAVAIDPNFAQAYCNGGLVLKELNRWDAALASYDRAVALDPALAEGYFNRGDALRELREYELAIANFDRAIALKPDLKGVYAMRLCARLQICDWAGFESEAAQLAERIERDAAVENPLCVVAVVGSARLQRKAAQAWVREEFPPNPALPPLAARAAHGKIRIGYFSADFRLHPVALLVAELIETHDRSRFEVCGFSLGPDTQDEMRKRLERAFDRFIDVRERSDQDIALLAREMQLDIAIDLGGFTEGGRTHIFALRAAPVQVNYLGYPGTMGSGYMDYLIADATTIAPDQRHHYGEKIAYLPNSYLANDTTRPVAPSVPGREQCGLPPSGCVFCCFNNHYKITPATFEGWMRILRAVEGSVLWLSEGHPRAIDNLRRAAELRGVPAVRLIFAKRLPSLPEHLARHRLADLFLDTLPYNAHTTASDALWAGLPVLTLLGDAFAGRVAASLLRAVGLPELITSTQEAYEQLAIELAGDPERLARLKQTLQRNRSSAPLFNTPLFAKHLEAAYTAMLNRHLLLLPPEDIYPENA